MHNSKEDLFYEIPTLSGINANEIIEKYGDSKGNWNEYYGFFAKPLPHEYVKKDFFLSWLNKKHEFRLVLTYLPPYSLYNWHVDDTRDVSLNMLLNYDGDSHCIFVRNYEQIINGNGLKSIKHQMFFEELKYKPNTYFLFNTSVYHSIWNIDKPRYAFIVDFVNKKDKINYEIVKKDIVSFYANGQTG